MEIYKVLLLMRSLKFKHEAVLINTPLLAFSWGRFFDISLFFSRCFYTLGLAPESEQRSQGFRGT